jgi:hypothetical protein
VVFVFSAGAGVGADFATSLSASSAAFNLFATEFGSAKEVNNYCIYTKANY